MFAENFLHFRDIWCDLLEVDFPTCLTSKLRMKEKMETQV